MKTILIFLVVLSNSLVVNSQEILPGNINSHTPLQDQHDYEYYRSEYNKASKSMKVWMGITFTGIGVSTLGIAIAGLSRGMDGLAPGGLLFVGGGVLILVGIPGWMANGIKRRNNKKAMEEAKVDLSFGSTHHGVGLILSF